MLFLGGHGMLAMMGSDRPKSGVHAMSAAAACGFAAGQKFEDEMKKAGRFGYFFEKADPLPPSDEVVGHLDALAEAMVRPRPELPTDSDIPQIFTFFGQFVDHDITANTDRHDAAVSTIDPEDGTMIAPQDRKKVSEHLMNLRSGALNLDNVHGGGPVQGEEAEIFDKALRFYDDRAKLWLGVASETGQNVPKPADLARDLLRLGRIVKGKGAPFDDAHFTGLMDPDLRKLFLRDDTTLNRQRAIIADMRNDENLGVAQVQLAMIRLHNRIVDHAAQDPAAPVDDRDMLFTWAREQMSWIYQWLVINAYLPAICDPVVLKKVMANGYGVYDQFFNDNTPAQPDLLPMPLEFSVAAFRMGHSMVREETDWNRFHGRPGANWANLGDLFRNTGGSPNSFDGLAHLPSHWAIEWDRFVEAAPASHADRSAKPIDTNLAPTLANLPNEEQGHSGLMKQLASRNLRRGYLLSLPTAQGCIDVLNKDFGAALTPLTEDQLQTGPTRAAVQAGGFEKHTPLWFYVLKEAELVHGGNRLGPLGTLLVAETLVGVVRHDPKSYWKIGAEGTWTPEDGIKPNGIAIKSMADLMRAALL